MIRPENFTLLKYEWLVGDKKARESVRVTWYIQQTSVCDGYTAVESTGGAIREYILFGLRTGDVFPEHSFFVASPLDQRC